MVITLQAFDYIMHVGHNLEVIEAKDYRQKKSVYFRSFFGRFFLRFFIDIFLMNACDEQKVEENK